MGFLELEECKLMFDELSDTNYELYDYSGSHSHKSK